MGVCSVLQVCMCMCGCVSERERESGGGGASRSFLNEGETKRSVEN